MAPRDRIAPALATVLEGLKLARRELAASGVDSERLRWVPVGLVAALQAGLVAALCGYETADPEDVTDPSDPDRIAPVMLLLRRARSAERLNPPERLALSGTETRAVDGVLAVRNAALHGIDPAGENPGYDAFRTVVNALDHLCLRHPAFPVADHGVMLSLIADEVAGLRSALGESG